MQKESVQFFLSHGGGPTTLVSIHSRCSAGDVHAAPEVNLHQKAARHGSSYQDAKILASWRSEQRICLSLFPTRRTA